MQTVKGMIEYAKAHNEAQIRTKFASDHRVESFVEQDNIRLDACDVWVFDMGLLKD